MPAILDDKFHIDQSPPETVHGAKPEPEERAVAHEMTLSPSAATNVDAHSPGAIRDAKHGAVVGAMPTTLIAEMSTYDAASIVGALCEGCVHFDQATWRARYEEMKKDTMNLAVQNDLDNLRLKFMVSKDPEIARRHGHKDGAINAEHILTNMGICSVFKMLCYPLSTCPDGHLPEWKGKTPKLEADMRAKRDLLLSGASAAVRK